MRGIEAARRHGIGLAHLEQHRLHGFAGERRPARQAMIEHRAQRIHIAGRTCLAHCARRACSGGM